MAEDYSNTLNLPKTDFPMRGNLPEREPLIAKRLEENKVYKKILEETSKTGKKFILHDGPPYANGDIHMGHSLNKIIKDIIVRYKTMQGYYSPYVPGWDTHGLPIEKKVQSEKKVFKDDVGAVTFREICKQYAMDAVANQSRQFKRLGGLGDYENNIYLTLDPEFEVSQLDIFWQMYKNGYIYRDLKPVYWCSDCETALAEAEIEYSDHETNSIYVRFKIDSSKTNGIFEGLVPCENNYVIIWTTTPWTLPGNQAITVNPDFNYAIIEVTESGKQVRYIMAEELVDKAIADMSISPDYMKVKVVKGTDLEGIECIKPLGFNGKSRILLGSPTDLEVTIDTGTGLVHTAPGHGHEDYLVCKRYGDIETVVPVDNKGFMTKEAGEFEGLKYSDANIKIIERLKETGDLMGIKTMLHQYPHCWRCKKPVIYRATTQWFASVKGFRDKVLEEIKNVKWNPEWGNERMTNMVKDRTDWCISRQRTWGVPIPIFYCKNCHKELINENTIERIKTLTSVNGSNMWFDLSAGQILKDMAVCPECGGKEFEKENDIMDVWFDSGSTFSSVLTQKKYGIEVEKADLYLEGNDQYRGWFQSSLLTSVATRGIAPYKEVLTHGMVVDGEGRKMSKSLGNGVDPLAIVNKYGADILRLWAVSSDYHTEVRLSEDILSQVSEVYKKLRNTIRFLLGNLSDFNIQTDIVPYSERDELDRYILYRVNKLIEYTVEAYESYDFHLIYSELHRFITTELSSKYLDVMKDRLYTFRQDHPLRRSAQSTMNDILRVLVRIIAPILPFTAEEVWSFMSHTEIKESQTVMLSGFPTERPEYTDNSLIEKWDRIFKIRDELAKYLEQARANKLIGQNLDACVTFATSGEELEFVKANSDNIALVCIVSQLEIVESDERKIEVEKAYGAKCARCWTYSDSVGRDFVHKDLCKKCLDNM
ncbi:MAG: isoleucine--tRNA ligase [Clostridia bacterium]|nr:isoleucine--tRNA ligase [Clostridia bacterium]